MVKIHRLNKQPKFYVSMTDKFMSGWGKAEGKTNKYVVGVNSYEQAKTIQRNAKRRPEMKYINISSRKPHYNRRHYKVSLTHWNKMGDIWKK